MLFGCLCVYVWLFQLFCLHHIRFFKTYRYKLYAERLRPLVTDTISYLHGALKDGRSVLVEGANAAMLDIDFGKLPGILMEFF